MRADKDRAYLDDIRESCALIIDYVRNKTFVDFVASRVLQDAVIRRLAVIGEASKNLSPTVKEKHSKIAWKDMGRLRDLVVHHYWTLDTTQVWEILKKDIPDLLKTLG